MVSTGVRVASKNPRCTVSGADMSSWTVGDVWRGASAGTMKSNQPKSDACQLARFRSPIDLLLCAPDRLIAARPPARRERARPDRTEESAPPHVLHDPLCVPSE